MIWGVLAICAVVAFGMLLCWHNFARRRSLEEFARRIGWSFDPRSRAESASVLCRFFGSSGVRVVALNSMWSDLRIRGKAVAVQAGDLAIERLQFSPMGLVSFLPLFVTYRDRASYVAAALPFGKDMQMRVQRRGRPRARSESTAAFDRVSPEEFVRLYELTCDTEGFADLFLGAVAPVIVQHDVEELQFVDGVLKFGNSNRTWTAKEIGRHLDVMQRVLELWIAACCEPSESGGTQRSSG